MVLTGKRGDMPQAAGLPPELSLIGAIEPNRDRRDVIQLMIVAMRPLTAENSGLILFPTRLTL